MRNWIIKKWPLIIVGLAIMAAIPWLAGYIFAYFVGSWDLSSKSTVTDNYEVFRDLLLVIGTISVVAYYIISRIWQKVREDDKKELKGIQEQHTSELEKKMNELKQTETEHKKELDEYAIYSTARSEAFLSFAKWKELEKNFLKTGKWEPDILEDAIYWANEALKRKNSLDGQKREKFLLEVMNILAYCLAVSTIKTDQERASSYAQIVFDNRTKFSDKLPHWEETYWWVKFHTADSSTELGKVGKKAATDEIKKIITNPHYAKP